MNESVDKSLVEKKIEIIKLLAYHGIHDYIMIEDEAVPFLLNALSQKDLTSVKLNGEGGIVVEFDDSNLTN